MSLPSLSWIVSPYSVTLFSFVVLLTLINAVCCQVHIWATVSGCCPGSQFEMPDALESVLQRDRGQSSNYCCGRPHRDMSPANHLLSPSLGNRLMSNQHPATLWFNPVIPSFLLLSTFTWATLPVRGLFPWCFPTLASIISFSVLPLFISYSVCPNWWISSPDATLTCSCPSPAFLYSLFPRLCFLLLGLSSLCHCQYTLISITLKPLTAEGNKVDHLAIVKCSSGKPFVEHCSAK